MPNPRTAAEWAEWCVDHGHRSRGIGGLLCLACADAYARQQVEALEELESLPTWGTYRGQSAVETVRLKLKENIAQIVSLIHERDEALAKIRQLREVDESLSS